MSPKDIDKIPTADILEDLFDNGFASVEIEVYPKLFVTMRNILPDDYLLLDSKVKASKVDELSNLAVAQLIALWKLSTCIIKIRKGGNEPLKLTGPDDVHEWLRKQPSSLIDFMLKLQAKFEEKTKSCITEDDIQENFSEAAGSPTGPEQSQKASMSDETEA